MKSEIIDISVNLNEDMTVWPDSSGINIKQVSSIDRGDSANVTCIKMDVHTGTHIENSLHFIKGGDDVGKIDLSLLVGEAEVIYVPNKKVITASDLKNLNSKRVLFKTDNSKIWESGKKEFQKNYVGLDISAASRIAQSNVKLVGIDYLSIAKFNETKEVHQILLKNNVIILETLNLSNVEAGSYKLICLPLKISKAEAVPARAVLIKQL